MITQINLNGFGNLPDIVQPLERLNLLTGENGAGKSARSIAICLTVWGYVPGGPRKNADILATYGQGDKLFPGITYDGIRFGRGFTKQLDGSVLQSYWLNGKKKAMKEYIQAIAPVRVLDLRAFMDLSEQRKIDHIFALYPPAGDLATLDDQIEALKTKRDGLAAKIKGLEQTVKRLTEARAMLELPAGTLAETIQEITSVEVALKQAVEEQHQAQVKEAQEKAAAQARADAEAKAAAELPGIEAAALAKAESAVYVKQQETAQAAQEIERPDSAAISSAIDKDKMFLHSDSRSTVDVFVKATKVDASHSIEAILDTMQRAGCTSCAASLVAKRELRKFREGGVA